MNFRIGDRVWDKKYGSGTVICIDDCPPNIGVCFDEAFGGHTLNDLCEPGHGYWVFEGFLTHLDERQEKMPPVKLQEGDRVIYLGTSHPKGSLGTVLRGGERTVPVRFDDPIRNGNDCDGLCEDGYGFYCSIGNLLPAQNIVSPTEFQTLLRGDHDA